MIMQGFDNVGVLVFDWKWQEKNRGGKKNTYIIRYFMARKCG